MSIMNIGVRALMVNQAALSTIGNNIANVNTPNYSRQQVVQNSVPGQFTGAGYFGNGVEITTVERIYSEFLTKQAAVTKAVASSDAVRLDRLRQLEDVFQGGDAGLGASINNMMNAFSDIVSAPTDMTARTVALTRSEETANRFRYAAAQLDDLRVGTVSQLNNTVDAINTLAKKIAQINDEVRRALGSGHDPNDLLDQRDGMINQLNQYVQTSTIKADDGSVNVFMGGSQALVLGTSASQLRRSDSASDPAQSKMDLLVGTQTVELTTTMLGGGELAGLMRFQNDDLTHASESVGFLAMAVGLRMNDQQQLGLTPADQQGMALFSMADLPDAFSTQYNTGNAKLGLTVQSNPSGAKDLFFTNYEMAFSSATTGTIRRLSDGTSVSFDFGATDPVQIDGLNISQLSGTANAGDRFVLKPFKNGATAMFTAFSSPRDLAMASPVAGNGGTNNAGTLQQVSLLARSMPAPAAVTLSFSVLAGPPVSYEYTRSDTGTATYTYQPGQPIEYATTTPTTTPGWTLTLAGVPVDGDTFTVKPNPYPELNADNARAMMALRDEALYENGPIMIDGYASIMSDVGIRVQSAKASSTVSTSIAANIEKERAGVSGVNLDEEAARMLQYQQAYQAAGKMIQIAANIFDTLLQSLGR